MARSIRHADLVARALGALSDEDRVRIDRALEADPSLRQQFEQVASHLVVYDNLPPAPPPPPFERVAAALDEDVSPEPRILDLARPRGRPRHRVVWAAAAAAVLVALLIWAPWGDEFSADSGLDVLPGRGIVLQRGHDVLPTPELARRPVRSGDRLRCERPAEAHLGARVRVVLDGGSDLVIVSAQAVELAVGRAFFDVAPGPFEVVTPHGVVRVRGTRFEVDLTADRLDVAVEQGHVQADGHDLRAGSRLAEGRVKSVRVPVGAWFRRPHLHLEPAGAKPLRVGESLVLRLVFSNPGQVPLRIEGPGATRTPVWIGFATQDGKVLGELPVLSANVLEGGHILTPGGSVRLEPGARAVLAVRILPPLGSTGAYRCRALYRPEEQPVVLSSTLALEVR